MYIFIEVSDYNANCRKRHERRLANSIANLRCASSSWRQPAGALPRPMALHWCPKWRKSFVYAFWTWSHRQTRYRSTNHIVPCKTDRYLFSSVFYPYYNHFSVQTNLQRRYTNRVNDFKHETLVK